MPNFIDIEAMFDEFLDEIYPSFQMGQLEFMPSDILKSCDPIAYRCGLADYESELEADEYVEL